MTTLTDGQLVELEKPLSQLLISTRKGGSGTTLQYIEGHDAIDQANRIFGYGQWGYRVLSCEQVVIHDVSTGDAIGVTFEAIVELQVAGCMTVADVGQQACSVWCVQDVIDSRRRNWSDETKQKPVDRYEVTQAQKAIVDAFEVARKGSITDAVKRCLRTLGAQFGNSLYGDGRVVLVNGDTLDEEQLKADWAKVYRIKDAEIDARWPRFIVYALGSMVKDLTADDKSTIHATIQQQLRKSA